VTAVPPPPAPRQSFTSRYARELSAAVGAPLTIWLIGWSHPYIFNLSIAIVAVLALYELLSMGQKKGYHLPIALCMVIALVIVSAFVLEHLSVEVAMFVTLLVIPAYYVFSKKIPLDEALPSSAIAVMATMYVGMLAGSLIRLRNEGKIGDEVMHRIERDLDLEESHLEL
jgi:CDP-diglyceride synthetase